jgi:putative tryptophan/tyrosine transport system substrate-binding protein
MKRREFITFVAGAATWPFARPLAADAQRRVGALLAPDNQPALDAFREGLATFGWVEGRNLRIDYRFSGDPRRLAEYAEELVNLRPDVIFAYSALAARAVQQRTSVIPIVFVGGADPTSSGLVRNIARPEGNMTGFANSYASLGGRWLELFKEAVPRLTRVADIFFATELTEISARNETRATIAAAAAQLGLTVTRMPLRNAVEIEPAINAFAAEPDGGLLLPGNPLPFGDQEIERLALYHHLPLMRGGSSDIAGREGFLMAHGPDILDLVRRASSYVDRILRGAKPSELPVQ